MRIARTGEPEQRHGGARQAEQGFPDFAIEREIAERAAVLVGNAIERTAAINWDPEGEARIDPDDGRGNDPAPRDAANADVCGVHFGQGAEQGVGENRGGDGVIHPLIGERLGGVAVDAGARGSGGGVAFPLGARRRVGDAFIGLAFDRDGDRGEALIVPFLHPFLECRTAAAVHEHDTGNFARAPGGKTEPSENARGFSPIWQALEPERFDCAGGGETLGRVDGGRRGQSAETGDLFAQRCEVGGRSGRVVSGSGERDEKNLVGFHSTGLRRIAWRLALSAGPSTRETAMVWRPVVLKVSKPKVCE